MTTGYTPIYRIMKDDVDITSRFNDRTTQINVELNSGGGEGDRCVIKVDDRDWRVARPFPGDNLDIWLGYQEVGLSFMGSFEVDDVTFLGMPRSIQLTGTSTGLRSLMKAPAIKEFDNKSVGDILGSMASKAGIGLSISADLAAKKLPFKNQVVSNLHMIHELERLYGAVAKIANGTLVFVPRDSTTSASGIEMPTLVLLPEHFGDWSVQYNSRAEYGQVKAAWRDKTDQIRKWVTTGAGSGGGGGSGETYAIGTLFNSMEEAQAAIESKKKALKRSEARALFDLAKGDPWIKDSQTLIVSGMRDGIDGSYVIEKATHMYVKNTGIKSKLECRPPGDGSNFADRATDEFLKPEPGELMGEVLKNGAFIGMPTQDWAP